MVDFSYDRFVVIAEKEWKLEYVGFPVEAEMRTVTFPVTIGDIEWKMCTSLCSYQKLHLTCTSVAERSVDQVHLEVHGYCRVGNASKYGPGIDFLNSQAYEETPVRHVFSQNFNSLEFMSTEDNQQELNLLFNVRVLEDRALFPDFKSKSVKVGSQESNLKLRVADQTFYVNKELLAMHSNYFDCLFYDDFKEAKQEATEIELKHEPANSELFEDFLLVLFVQNALPNRKNLSGLFKLAYFYQADNVHEKCERLFRMCREMPVEEQYMLALELGNEQMKDSVLHTVNLAEAKRIIAAHERERTAQQLKLADALTKCSREIGDSDTEEPEKKKRKRQPDQDEEANPSNSSVIIATEKRYMHALKLGNEQEKNSILHTVDLADTKRIIAMHEMERAERELKLAGALAKIDQLAAEALAKK